MGPYLAVVALIVLAVLFAAISLVVSVFLNKRHPNAAKGAPYECGIVPSREPPNRFPVGFYLVAMLFIMFDIEIVFLYPYAVSRQTLGGYGFWEIISFSAVFFLAIVYVVAKGALDWGPLHRRQALDGAVTPERTSATTVRRVGLEGRREVAEGGEAA
ncbi:MAG: NADH-quinone oxidoreductase subunit [Acidimicrobiaceae bacterium]|jgi:NADH-quinone oxidoreductase subunit A|nr:NADH-quinone oxidoreductase subunit [Acidimicrobiaceae bacterium]